MVIRHDLYGYRFDCSATLNLEEVFSVICVFNKQLSIAILGMTAKVIGTSRTGN